MNEIEFILLFILLLIGVLMFVGIKFILKYLSDIIEELRKLNQNKEDEGSSNI
jgi:hypothetical protein